MGGGGGGGRLTGTALRCSVKQVKSVFHERGKPKYLEKNLSEQGGEQKT